MRTRILTERTFFKIGEIQFYVASQTYPRSMLSQQDLEWSVGGKVVYDTVIRLIKSIEVEMPLECVLLTPVKKFYTDRA